MKKSLMVVSAALALTVVIMLPGCSSLAYYWQGAAGQFDLWWRTQSIDQMVADPSTDAVLKQKLQLVRSIREYASQQLALPDNGSYRVYADVGRPYVTWNVFAAPEFSLAPREWCFPVAGCVSYRGYFSQQAAKDEAASLRQEGYDVYVGGVPAYSTLGYFDDPVLSTFVRSPDVELARLIFHELSHQVIYVKGDSTFNESFAVSVEEEGTRRWLASHGTPEQTETFERTQRRRADFRDLVSSYRKQFKTLYEQTLPSQRMREEKAKLFEAMRADYAKLKASWGGWGGYDRWFAQGLNNANIVSVGLYNELVPAFEVLLKDAHGDMKTYYAKVHALASLPAKQRHSRLVQLMPTHSAAKAR